jgi:hypothetical protein
VQTESGAFYLSRGYFRSFEVPSADESGMMFGKIRALAVITACSSAILWPDALFGAPLLLLAALVQPRAQTSGRWLMWVSALFLSSLVVPIGTDFLNLVMTLGSAPEPVTLLILTFAVLICYCDVVLFVEGMRQRRTPWVSGRLDWIVWIVAAVFSAWFLFYQNYATVSSYISQGGLRMDLILTAVVFDVVVLLFDAALILLFLRTRRHPALT